MNKENFLLEISKMEKKLWGLIYSKGLLQTDAREIYSKICLNYESFILSDHDLTELQDVEYSLWKLHYKHIDEFRKRTKRSSANSESKTSDDKHLEGFKTFLVKATEFYKKLIVKIRSHYGLPEESSLKKGEGNTASVELKKMQKCQFLCHRFLVCLGDLARYLEQYEKSCYQKHNWSVAATYYLEATKIWPDSGNPQNQLAVLATYVGDEFLALYHCIRSLAVKEPFPDAWNNLILLFERNRSCHLHCLSSESQFDFLKPSSRTISDCFMLKDEHDQNVESHFWPLLIRTLCFFFLKSSLENFSCAFASTMIMLDMMMAFDDTKLRAMLESYQLMDSARAGPFRSLQAVSTFIFVFHNLINSPEIKESKEGKHKQQLELIQLVLTAIFIFMGRLVERCLKANLLESCPLLPTVLVFVEWLVTTLDEVEAYGGDEKTIRAMSYFFAAFVDLLKHFNIRIGSQSDERTALWEDYELRGFAPLAQIHISLDFSTNWDRLDSYQSGIEFRILRIKSAAMKIADRSNGSCKWITHDSSARKFCVADTIVLHERPEQANVESSSSNVNVKGPHLTGENLNKDSVNGKSVAMEEEEVILFKPLTRHNSAPLYGKSNNAKDPPSPEAEESISSDECLRRATSLLIAQTQGAGDASDFYSDISNFGGTKPFKQQEHSAKDTTAVSFSEVPISARPPSLNAWVLNRGSSSSAEKEINDVSREGLSTIQEIPSPSLSGLSIHETQDSVISSRPEDSTHHYSTPPYSAPVPSAPLLPEDASWFNATQSSSSEVKGSVSFNEADNLNDVSRLSGLDSQLNFSSAIPGFMNRYPPFGGMTSSEWLRQYRESRNANCHVLPINYCTSGNPMNFPNPNTSRFGLFDQYGVPSVPGLHPGYPLVYGVDEQIRERLIHGYQIPSPYGCGAMTELKDDPEPLLQYLKEKEWILQKDPPLRNPTYMGN